MSFLVSVLMVIVLGIGSVFGFYNSLVSARENVDSKWSQVDNQLQRRSDLIPNLVNTVKGYAAHEKEVYTSVNLIQRVQSRTLVERALLRREHVGHHVLAASGKDELHVGQRLDIGPQQRLHGHPLIVPDLLEFVDSDNHFSGPFFQVIQ